jgi:three-Cys-motif partner protein
MNRFGGNWTDQKMDIVEAYAKAYLKIMRRQKWARTIYFDGFAGSGSIEDIYSIESLPTGTLFGSVQPAECQHLQHNEQPKKGTALRILDIIDPKSFDLYYFVEKNEAHCLELRKQIKSNYPNREAYVVREDCNRKLLDLANYLKPRRNYRALVFIDPYGMSVNWSSIEALAGLGIDLWILVPTGVGANRLLVNDGNIPESWLRTLETFLGINGSEIKQLFYKQQPTITDLFGEVISQAEMRKEGDTVNKVARLYSNKLKRIFKYVSDPFVMRNSMNSIMYHFMMATNNKNALKIANDVIKPKYKL